MIKRPSSCERKNIVSGDYWWEFILNWSFQMQEKSHEWMKTSLSVFFSIEENTNVWPLRSKKFHEHHHFHSANYFFKSQHLQLDHQTKDFLLSWSTFNKNNNGNKVYNCVVRLEMVCFYGRRPFSSLAISVKWKFWSYEFQQIFAAYSDEWVEILFWFLN